MSVKTITDDIWTAAERAIDDGWPVLRFLAECKNAWLEIKNNNLDGDKSIWEKIIK